MRNYPVKILNAADTGSETGSAFFVGQAASASFTAIFGDTSAAGSVKIQGSNEIPVGDPKVYVPSAGSFADIPNATSAIAAGIGPAIVLPSMNFQYIRTIFTASNAGNTTIQVFMSALQV